MPKLTPPEILANRLERISVQCFGEIDRLQRLKNQWEDHAAKADELDLGTQHGEIRRKLDKVSWMISGLEEPLHEITWAIAEAEEALRACAADRD